MCIIPGCDFDCCGDDVACGAPTEDGGTASDIAGDCTADATDSSAAWPETDADDSIGLGADTDGCVKLGDEETPDN